MSVLRFFCRFSKLTCYHVRVRDYIQYFSGGLLKQINRLIVFLTAVSSRTHPEGIPKKSRG